MRKTSWQKFPTQFGVVSFMALALAWSAPAKAQYLDVATMQVFGEGVNAYATWTTKYPDSTNSTLEVRVTVTPDQTKNGVWLTTGYGDAKVQFVPFSSSGAKPTEVVWSEANQMVYVLCPGIGKIIRYSLSNPTYYGSPALVELGSISVSGLQTNSNLVMDSAGNYYVSTNGAVTQMPSLAMASKQSARLRPLADALTSPTTNSFAIPTPAGAAAPPSPLNLVVDASNNVWFTQTPPSDAIGNPLITGQEYIGMLTPAGVVSQFAVPTKYAGTGDTNTTVGNYIALGPDGNIWFTEEYAAKIGRVTAAGVMTEFPLPAGASTLLGIVAGPDGNLWIRDYAGKIYRMSTSGAVATFTIPNANVGSDRELVRGADGALWFPEDSKIGRITTSGAITEYPLPTPTVNGNPMYPFRLQMLPNGSGMFIEYSANTIVGFSVAASSVNLVAGWNLVGNGIEAPMPVSGTFNDPTKVATVWKWIVSGSTAGIAYPTWAFYSPNLSGGGQAYAASKGYDFLTTINAGEGFWVNAKTAFAAPLPSAAEVLPSSFIPALSSPATAGGAHALSHGWNLVATGGSPTPTQFDVSIATSQATQPASGQVYTNLTTLWSWDASLANWYFWAPSMVNSGGLAAYITNKSYLDFTFLPTPLAGTLSPTTGFWVNIP